MPAQTTDIERLQRLDHGTDEYRVAMITDEDQAAEVTLEDGQVAWQSTVRYDRLYRTVDSGGRARYELRPIPEEEGGVHRLMSLVAEGGRGAEFSELALFGDRLLAFDDRTGLVCEIREGGQLVPRQILMTGSGDEKFKGYKAEWATIKGDSVYIGSHGRTKLVNGQATTGPLEWVKVLDRGYRCYSIDWHDRYEKMRRALGIDSTEGYLTHEAAEWHPYRHEWYFFPRKVSYENFDEEKDEAEKGGNLLLVADENFKHVDAIEVGERVPDRGVSSFKFVPGHPDECVGLKSVEKGGETATYFFAFDMNGRMLADEIFLGSYKCEGIEFA